MTWLEDFLTSKARNDVAPGATTGVSETVVSHWPCVRHMAVASGKRSEGDIA